MKPLLIVMLVASLAANLVLVVISQKTGSSETPVPTSPSGVKSSSAARANESPSTDASIPASTATSSPMQAGARTSGTTWHPVDSESELHGLVDNLRAAGYPAAVIRAVVNELLNQRFASRQPNVGKPFWKQSAQNEQAVATQIALSNERQALFEALLGPDARPSAILDASTRERRYGLLSDEKIDAIAKIERDYNELTAETWAKRKGNMAVSAETMQQTQQLMEKEKLADLAGVLTPEELAQYEMRQSPSARNLIAKLRNVDVTESEYARLYAAQKTFDAANPRTTSPDASTYAQRQLAQLALNEENRSVLGDTRFYSYLEGADPMYANVAKVFTPFPAVTPASTYQVYQLQTELQNLLTQTSRAGKMTPDKIAEMRTTVDSYNVKLEALVGTDAAAAYRNQGMGRVFSTMRSAPKTTQPGGG